MKLRKFIVILSYAICTIAATTVMVDALAVPRGYCSRKDHDPATTCIEQPLDAMTNWRDADPKLTELNAGNGRIFDVTCSGHNKQAIWDLVLPKGKSACDDIDGRGFSIGEWPNQPSSRSIDHTQLFLTETDGDSDWINVIHCRVDCRVDKNTGQFYGCKDGQWSVEKSKIPGIRDTVYCQGYPVPPVSS